MGTNGILLVLLDGGMALELSFSLEICKEEGLKAV